MGRRRSRASYRPVYGPAVQNVWQRKDKPLSPLHAGNDPAGEPHGVQDAENIAKGLWHEGDLYNPAAASPIGKAEAAQDVQNAPKRRKGEADPYRSYPDLVRQTQGFQAAQYLNSEGQGSYYRPRAAEQSESRSPRHPLPSINPLSEELFYIDTQSHSHLLPNSHPPNGERRPRVRERKRRKRHELARQEHTSLPEDAAPSANTRVAKVDELPTAPEMFLPPESTKATKRIARINDLNEKIRLIRQELPYLPKHLRAEQECQLASHQMELHRTEDRSGPIKRRYNALRMTERSHALRELNALRKVEKPLQLLVDKAREMRIKQEKYMNKSKIEGAEERNIDKLGKLRIKQEDTENAVVSEDEEEGGVCLAAQGTGDLFFTDASADAGLADIGLTAEESRLKEELGELLAKIHNAEVDYNYCCFAPLQEPYICLYPADERGRIMRFRRKSGIVNERKGPDKEDVARKDQESGILRTSTGAKPPFWSEVEERMRRGTLEELRDGKLNALSGQHDLLELGDKNAAEERATVGAGMKRGRDWMMEDDEIPQEFLDTEDDEDYEDM